MLEQKMKPSLGLKMALSGLGIVEGLGDVQCLFCEVLHSSLEASIYHCKTEHYFDLHQYKEAQNLNFNQYVQLIKYIRSETPSVEALLSNVPHEWIDVENVDPVDAADPYLWDEFLKVIFPKSNNETLFAKEEGNSVTLSLYDFQEMNRTVKELMTAVNDIRVEDQKTGEEMETTEDTLSEKSSFRSKPSFFSDTVLDNVFISAYHRAIMRNAELFKDKTVLNLNCNSGILALFAVQAGARKVYAVQHANVIKAAEDVFRENKCLDKIECIQSTIRSSVLPLVKVDIIITKWMRNGIFSEFSLDSLLFARDVYLKPGGLILPNQVQLHICGINDPVRHHQLFTFWENVYGFQIGSLKFDPKYCVFTSIKANYICTTSDCLITLDLSGCSKKDTRFESSFQLLACANTKLTSFCIFHDMSFLLPEHVSFSTSPLEDETHWSHCVLWLETPLTLSEGEIIRGTLSYSPSSTNPMQMKLKLNLHDLGRKFSFRIK